jgi:hypothetical protein
MALGNVRKNPEKKKRYVPIRCDPSNIKIYLHVFRHITAANVVGLPLELMCQCLQDAFTDSRNKLRLDFGFISKTLGFCS